MVLWAGIRHLRGNRTESQLSAEQVFKNSKSCDSDTETERNPKLLPDIYQRDNKWRGVKGEKTGKKDELSTEEADVLTATVLAWRVEARENVNLRKSEFLFHGTLYKGKYTAVLLPFL